MLPTERRRSPSRGSLRIVSGLAENTNSIFCDDSSESETANGCLVLPSAGTDAERHTVRVEHPGALTCTLSRACPGHPCLRLTDDLHGCRQTAPYAWGGIPVIRQGPCDGPEKPCHKPTSRYQSGLLRSGNSKSNTPHQSQTSKGSDWKRLEKALSSRARRLPARTGPS